MGYAGENRGSGPIPGRLIVVLGASGSGKDSLISHARAQFSGVDGLLFVQRAITRADDDGAEDHVAMTDAEFDAAQDSGAFVLTWTANGLRYGLPRILEAHLSDGGVAVVNGSRGAWDALLKIFPNAMAVEIRVDPETLAERLRARGRENEIEIEARLARATALENQFLTDAVIDNSGLLETAGAALGEIVRNALTDAGHGEPTAR
ncbi:phosphonate metabolism protein/1,5-bisphosphokinase (PRPP-forming) PhnN [Hoeflea sp. G2-23]|uniref:Ribose 1,5-bisphosphate phosphokinase PhnN n=1 Tax=Hoeflea algicola TaxID=2983763 RepID=A0ABT3Z805_9HYPH|nr:phosphonate metabolism protein/1,5-bisphosphokinase (PRPP-forming) PhnN [Hoeflea algicola]MCY0147469.1 phosphonate metabolism protein/1,5-bisphosphokinase (PRPP-forming) PhnN [Hoeflea algicola]